MADAPGDACGFQPPMAGACCGTRPQHSTGGEDLPSHADSANPCSDGRDGILAATAAGDRTLTPVSFFAGLLSELARFAGPVDPVGKAGIAGAIGGWRCT